jgi:hypothetical protein
MLQLKYLSSEGAPSSPPSKCEYVSPFISSASSQLEDVRTNGLCTIHLTESLMDLVAKLTQEVMYLKKDNVCMREEIVSLRSFLVASPQCIPMVQLIWSAAASSTNEAYPQAHQQVLLTVPSTKVNHAHALPVMWLQLGFYLEGLLCYLIVKVSKPSHTKR